MNMSGNVNNSYGYYYNGPQNSYQEQPQQVNNWSPQQYTQNYQRNPNYYGNNINRPHLNQNHFGAQNLVRPHFSNIQSNPRIYHQRIRYNRNNDYSNPYLQKNRPRNNTYKKPRLDSQSSTETKTKTSKKKKKPLSQNVPSIRSWSIEDAEKALATEKEYNRKFKNQSIIIKFPDPEINKEIVTNFNPAIENVHFQHPSTPRYCFVTLKDPADPEAVINALNAHKFGEGYLKAEYKKDREEDQNIGPQDIDPLTLYVGNLSQEITKESMVNIFPKSRRIDIGFAKKMKFTRYAFVTFRNVDDSIETFKRTRSTQLHSKSLIVRFRRLHGTVGMPGESKPQNPTKKTNEVQTNTNPAPADVSAAVTDVPSKTEEVVIDVSNIKEEPLDEEIDIKPIVNTKTCFLPGNIDEYCANHLPIMKIKEEKDDELFKEEILSTSFASSSLFGSPTCKSEYSETEVYEHDFDEDEDYEDDMNFYEMLGNMEKHNSEMQNLRESNNAEH